MIEYPKWVNDKIVQDEAEELALIGETKAVSREELILQAEAKGLKVDKRWSDTRLAEEIAKEV